MSNNNDSKQCPTMEADANALQAIRDKIRKRRADVVDIIASKIPAMKNHEFAANRIREVEAEVHKDLFAEGWISTGITGDAVAAKGLVGLDHFSWLTDADLWTKYQDSMDTGYREFPYWKDPPDERSKPISELHLEFSRQLKETSGQKQKITFEESEDPIAKRLKQHMDAKEPATKEEWSTQNAWKMLYPDVAPPVKEHVFALPLEKDWESLVGQSALHYANWVISSSVTVKVYDTKPKKSIGVMFTPQAKYKSTRHVRDLHEVWVMLRGWHAGLSACLHFQPLSAFIEGEQRIGLQREMTQALMS